MNRTAMLAIILVLAAVSIGSLAAFIHERNKPAGIEVRIDKHGLRIGDR